MQALMGICTNLDETKDSGYKNEDTSLENMNVHTERKFKRNTRLSASTMSDKLISTLPPDLRDFP